MRINKFVAQATGISRRKSDELINSGKILLNGQVAKLGQDVTEQDRLVYMGKDLFIDKNEIIILLNKPLGYVCSRNGQGSPTVYELLPPIYKNLKIVGRLDKDSHGLVLLTNNGDLAQQLAHPSYQKSKQYLISLDKALIPPDIKRLLSGVLLSDGLSKFNSIDKKEDNKWLVSLSQGRNRQIRRSFKFLGYEVLSLERISLGKYELGDLPPKQYLVLKS